MKRGTPNHRKMHELAKYLNLPLYGAVGIMEMLWHFAGQQTPEGDIGRLADRQIAAAVDWNKKPEALVKALVDSRWLDPNETYRLIIHDWPEHVEYEVARKLLHDKKDFVSAYGKSAQERVKPSEFARSLRVNCAPHAKASGLGSVSSSENKRIQEVAEMWLQAGFEGPDHFEDWWLQVVSNHPNKNRNQHAKMLIMPLIIEAQFKRSEFEDGYSQLYESKKEDWTKEGGKYCTNLYDIVHDRLWKFKPIEGSDWVQDLAAEQALERRQMA
jgi:hypothetical protein